MPANLITGKPRMRCHHCMKCDGAIKRTCYKKRHVAVCSAVLSGGRICGETFTVISRGCFRHTYADGFNPGVKSGEVSDNHHIREHFYRFEVEESDDIGKQPGIDVHILKKKWLEKAVKH